MPVSFGAQILARLAACYKKRRAGFAGADHARQSELQCRLQLASAALRRSDPACQFRNRAVQWAAIQEWDRATVSPHRGNQSKPRNQGRANARRRQPGKGRAQRIGTLFEKLVALQALLRSARGCPWDREQTHQSLRTYLVEETYEVLDALDSGDSAQLASELGDLLLQIVFHAQLAQEAGRFDIGDVIERIHVKMVRRHPHVFGDVRAKSSAQVLRRWEELKAAERQGHAEGRASAAAAEASLLDGIPRALPALLEAYQLTRRASRVGFDWDNIEGLLEKLREETAELRQTLSQRDRARLEEEVGDLLFVAVNVARFLDVDPEIALNKANRKFVARFKEMEREAARAGRRLADVSRDELETLWEASKGKSFPATTTGARK